MRFLQRRRGAVIVACSSVIQFPLMITGAISMVTATTRVTSVVDYPGFHSPTAKGRDNPCPGPTRRLVRLCGAAAPLGADRGIISSILRLRSVPFEVMSAIRSRVLVPAEALGPWLAYRQLVYATTGILRHCHNRCFEYRAAPVGDFVESLVATSSGLVPHCRNNRTRSAPHPTCGVSHSYLPGHVVVNRGAVRS